MVEEFIAALRSFLIQLTTVAVIIDIKINVNANHNFPFNGENPTIAKVAMTVNNAPSRSVIKSFGVSFQGCSGFTINTLWLIFTLSLSY